MPQPNHKDELLAVVRDQLECLDDNGYLLPRCKEYYKRLGRKALRLRYMIAIQEKRARQALIIIVLLFSPLIAERANAGTIPQSTAVRCIIGEASNQGYNGMLSLAGALRNRGATQGVYGCNSKHIDKQPKWVFDLALKAWLESANNDITDGATHWENVNAFGKPYWADKMTMTFEYKDHKFYK